MFPTPTPHFVASPFRRPGDPSFPTTHGSLAIYFAELRQYDVLSPEEETNIARAARTGDEAARQALVTHNLRFVVSVARRFNSAGVPLEDLIQEGNRGLLRAADRFDPEVGVRFVTYAAYWIEQAILLWLASQQRVVRLPAGRQTQLSRLRRMVREWEREHGRAPSLDEAAEHLEMDAALVATLLNVGRPELRLDATTPGEDGSPLSHRLPGRSSAAARAERWSRTQALEAALGTLRPRDAQVLRLFVGLDGGRERTLEEIGAELGVTRERVRQIKKRALEQLGNSAAAELLREHF